MLKHFLPGLQAMTGQAALDDLRTLWRLDDLGVSQQDRLNRVVTVRHRYVRMAQHPVLGIGVVDESDAIAHLCSDRFNIDGAETKVGPVDHQGGQHRFLRCSSFPDERQFTIVPVGGPEGAYLGSAVPETTSVGLDAAKDASRRNRVSGLERDRQTE